MDTAVVRRATDGDIDQVRLHQTAWAEEDCTYGYAADSSENIAQRLGPWFLIAELNQRIVGHVYGTLRVSEGLAVLPAGERYFEIEDMYVQPEHRDEGIGGMLLDRLMTSVRENGVHRFMVYSSTKDSDTITRFYRRHGFRTWYVQMFI